MNEETKKDFNESVLLAISQINKNTTGELTFEMNRHVNTSFWGTKVLSRTTVIEIKITENL